MPSSRNAANPKHSLLPEDGTRHPTLALAVQCLGKSTDDVSRRTIERLVVQAIDDEVLLAKHSVGEFGPAQMRALTATMKRLQSVIS